MLILQKTVCCDPSSEPSQRDSSDEGSQHIVSMRNAAQHTANGRMPRLTYFVHFVIKAHDCGLEVYGV